MAEVSPDIIERVVLGIVGVTGTVVSGIGAWMFNHLKSENVMLKKELNDHIEKNDKDIHEVHDNVRLSEEKILKAISEMKGTLIPISLCDSKQDLWLERFSNFQAIVESNTAHNSEQHQDIVATLTQLTAEQKETTKCIQKLSLGFKSCD